LAFIDWGSWWLGPEWVYVDETKIKARDRTYYLWLAVDENSLQWNGYMRLWMSKKLTSSRKFPCGFKQYIRLVWVYVDETKIKARDGTYYLWLAVDEKGLPVFVHLSRRRDSWTAKLVAKYETIYGWLASFIVIYTIMNLKS
jgi:transposase-like protein